MGHSGAGGILIHKKNQKQKISWHCPFKHSLGIYLIFFVLLYISRYVNCFTDSFTWSALPKYLIPFLNFFLKVYKSYSY